MKKLKLILLAIIGVAISFLSSDAIQMKSHYLNRRLRHRNHHRITHHFNTEYKNMSYLNDISFHNPLHEDLPGNLSYAIDRQLQNEIDSEGKEAKKRSKRGTFAWPPDSLFIAQFSLEIPIYSPQGVDIPLLLEVPYEIDLPNVTESIITGRKGDDRLSFFGTMESLFSRFGFHGESCMLRAICERAEANILTKGLLGEVLNLVLAVSTAESEHSNTLLMDHYREAEYHGKTHGDCSIKYSQCPLSIFHFFE